MLRSPYHINDDADDKKDEDEEGKKTDKQPVSASQLFDSEASHPRTRLSAMFLSSFSTRCAPSKKCTDHKIWKRQLPGKIQKRVITTHSRDQGAGWFNTLRAVRVATSV